MATFPNAENDVVALAAQMESGYTAHALDFPSVTVLDLTTALADYNTALASQQDTRSQAKQATTAEDTKLTELVTVMKNDLKLSEVDTISDPVKLAEIGWGPKAPPTPLMPPDMATNLTPLNEGPGTVHLEWDKPTDGGAVRHYIIQRQQADASGVFGNWQMLGFAYDNATSLSDQPCGIQMHYRVICSNTAGQSLPSNTVLVVL